jgi:thioredoxin-like negative regulator of GroEL
VAGEFGDAVDLRFIDIDNPANDDLVLEYGVSAIPHVVILDQNGQVSSVWRGLTSAKRLRRAIEKVLIASQT